MFWLLLKAFLKYSYLSKGFPYLAKVLLATVELQNNDTWSLGKQVLEYQGFEDY